MKVENKRFKIAKWIMLSLAVLSNAFIVFYSCLSNEDTKKLSAPFTNFFVSIINTFSNKEVKTIPLENINISFSDDKYNSIPGYKLEEIPLGSAKEISCSFNPVDATNQSISYSVEPTDAAVLNPSGNKVSVVGMKTGNCIVKAKSADGGFESSVPVTIVDTVAPTSYTIAIDNPNIQIGTTKTIDFDIDGGVLGHDELINFRYYDTRELTYTSSDEAIAKVDKYGVIYPESTGSATISVSNGTFVKQLSVNVVGGSPAPLYANLSIIGNNVCHANDMILDQSSKKNHVQLTPKDGETALNPNDFIWSSSNELLAKVDKHGVVRGFRKNVADDQSVVITAKSKATGQTATFTLLVKNQSPTKLTVSLITGGKEFWSPNNRTLVVGDSAYLKLYFSPSLCDKSIEAISSNEEVISLSPGGNVINMFVLKEGSCDITVTSLVNRDLTTKISFTVLKAGAISNSDIDDADYSVRKSVGHAAVFMVAQIFTFLTLYMFLYNKKWWLFTSISLGEGLFISGLSELIQHFVPTRKGNWVDVAIDFAGVVVGAALTFLGILLVKKIKQKKQNKNSKSEN